MLVARIAQNILETEDPNALRLAIGYLKLFSQFTGEKDMPFVEAATWPDKIKEDHNRMMGSWHFVNNIFSVDGTPIDEIGRSKAHDSYNVTVQINDAISGLEFPDDAGKDSKFYGGQDRRYMKSFDLRNLIHFVGDIHQPLHATTAVTKAHPHGDEGGNSVKLYMKGFDGDNLHFYWDHMFYHWSPNGKDEGELTSPLQDHNKDFPAKYAAEIMKEYPRDNWDETDYTDIDPYKWGMESMGIAKEKAYPVKEHRPLPQDYIDMGRATCKERVAIAGYRLAEVIKKCFEKYPKPEMSVISE